MNHEETQGIHYSSKNLHQRRKPLFEHLIADYSVPHHIVGPKDLGLDYICEWVYGKKQKGRSLRQEAWERRKLM